MDLQPLIDLLDDVQDVIEAGFPGPIPKSSYSISLEDEVSAEMWIREWIRLGGEVHPLTPQLCRALLPRFEAARHYIIRRASALEEANVESAADIALFYEAMLIDAWPRLRTWWQAGDSFQN